MYTSHIYVYVHNTALKLSSFPTAGDQIQVGGNEPEEGSYVFTA